MTELEKAVIEYIDKIGLKDLGKSALYNAFLAGAERERQKSIEFINELLKIVRHERNSAQGSEFDSRLKQFDRGWKSAGDAIEQKMKEALKKYRGEE